MRRNHCRHQRTQLANFLSRKWRDHMQSTHGRSSVMRPKNAAENVGGRSLWNLDAVTRIWIGSLCEVMWSKFWKQVSKLRAYAMLTSITTDWWSKFEFAKILFSLRLELNTWTVYHLFKFESCVKQKTLLTFKVPVGAKWLHVSIANLKHFCTLLKWAKRCNCSPASASRRPPLRLPLPDQAGKWSPLNNLSR